MPDAELVKAIPESVQTIHALGPWGIRLLGLLLTYLAVREYLSGPCMRSEKKEARRWGFAVLAGFVALWLVLGWMRG